MLQGIRRDPWHGAGGYMEKKNIVDAHTARNIVTCLSVDTDMRHGTHTGNDLKTCQVYIWFHALVP
jgi:hypothetical protein